MQPLPVYAYYWRRKCVLDLQAHHREMTKHRDDIQRLQQQLALRVSGIEKVLDLLRQAVEQLDAAPAPALYSGKRRGRPRKHPPAEAAAAAEAAE
jgi:hypothetical protein